MTNKSIQYIQIVQMKKYINKSVYFKKVYKHCVACTQGDSQMTMMYKLYIYIYTNNILQLRVQDLLILITTKIYYQFN